MNKIKVFLIPFAGGSEYSFFDFKQQESNELEMIPVGLPGRGKRIVEDKIDDLHGLAEDVFNTISGQLDSPYVIYGHSMGAMLTALVTEKIQKSGKNGPLAIFVSGCGSPTLKTEKLSRHALPDNEFISMLEEMGGSPQEILENESLLAFFLPVLRSDFKAVDLFQYNSMDQLNCPIHVMFGKDEKVTREAAEAWSEITTEQTKVYEFTGGHFFIYEHLPEIISILKANATTKFNFKF